MDEEKKKRKKKPADAGDSGHKKPWQETYATPEEIKAMLADRVLLRYNEVRGRTEIQCLTQHNRRYHVVRRQSDEIKLHREQPDLGADGSGEVW